MEFDDDKTKTPNGFETYAAGDADDAHDDDDDDDDENSAGRPQLVSQLESLEGEESRDLTDVRSSKIAKTRDAVVGSCASETTNEEIIKELKEMKKQNIITHCLLSGLIVLTIAWQLSEVSLILKIKDGLSNPLKSAGGIISGMFKGHPNSNIQYAMKHASRKEKEIPELNSFPGIKIPGFPLEELLGVDSSEDDD